MIQKEDSFGSMQSQWKYQVLLQLLKSLSLQIFTLSAGSCHRKLSSARSLQSRHISSSSVMSSKVSPSRLAKVELLEPVSMALSSDV